MGALGAWIGCRRRGIALPAYADAIAPGIAFAQAVGRWGNWFNQELYGRPTTLPWGLKIDVDHRPDATPDLATYHPTFLYESLWCVGVALLVIWADRRFKLGHGRAFALYVAAYTVGRFWIEHMRVDYAHHILGMRLNDWTAILVFAAAVAYLVVSQRLYPGREQTVEPVAAVAADGAAETAEGAAENADGTARAGADDAAEQAEEGAEPAAAPDAAALADEPAESAEPLEDDAAEPAGKPAAG
jgi:hypothetical protein